ncbi:homocysteine S-methyltransferase [Nocardioides marmoriginsengisoli]|uniref:Homocysteine S-methyltransferase n=1 Tax=Nocardioides marmoriginsengisoli TaxID=661483 RepID=A0A3N0CP84_9ACTN|nr:homocysteine S-methyltransferase family protein [Nocardioides marmoriginsengisoli]RNL65268.1 homocysteine S-methyltransferase [Nocardioides marmoriginsengisoli]
MSTDVLGSSSWVTDGGLETDLIFHRGFDLPEFASFPLVDDEAGRTALLRYFREYDEIAAVAGAGVLLETPTWRANPDWGRVLGYDAAALDRVNQEAVALVRSIDAAAERCLTSGAVGPRGDGYQAEVIDPDEAAEYHAAQVRSFAAAGADLVHAMTMTGPNEAIGVVRAARAAGVPVAVSFTVETDGVLPDGRTLRQAVTDVEAASPADWYGVNCAHPTHLVHALDGGEWQQHLRFLRPNASTQSHEELDASEVLDTGDVELLRSSTATIRDLVPSVAVLGGCCGTDSSHVAALWGVPRRTS